MKVTIEKNTDQLNYEDFLGGVTRIVTIAGVKKGTKEQQYDIAIEGDERFWRPPPTVLKLLVAAWGDDATEWVSRRAELYGDPTITFGREKVGGIRVSRLSHIAGAVSANLTETRGKRKVHTVDPLPDTPAKPTPTELAAQVAAALQDATTEAEVREWGNRAHERSLLDISPAGSPGTLREMVQARLAEVAATSEGGEES